MYEVYLENLKKLDEVILKYIRPITYPVAFKFFKKGEEVPQRAKIPTRDIGNKIAFCQAVSIARKIGWTVAVYKEDQACPVGNVILGYVEEPEFVKDGSLIKPIYADNDEAAILSQNITPKMPSPDTHCIVVAPLDKCTFKPDVILCYGNAAQITRYVQGSLYKTGGYVESRFTGRGACGSEFVVPYLTQECKVINPGGGERVFAMTADDELCFAIPYNKIDDVIEGLITTHRYGAARIPTPVAGIYRQPVFPKYYDELDNYCMQK